MAFAATAEQSGYDPGARVSLRATVAQSGLPTGGAGVWGRCRAARWGGEHAGVQGDVARRVRGAVRHHDAGHLSLRARARGQTRKGLPFTRERALTAVVWRGGDHDAQVGANPGGSIGDVIREHDARWCALMHCLVRGDGAITPELEKRLKAAGLDMNQLRKCLDAYCRTSRPPANGSGAASEDV